MRARPRLRAAVLTLVTSCERGLPAFAVMHPTGSSGLERERAGPGHGRADLRLPRGRQSSAGRSRRASDQRAVIADARCTIVVATRDRHDQLAATLPRHLALPERPHVVVVDDASSEPVVAPGADVLRLERGAGGAARNAGARASTTPYVAFTDDDAWWDPGALRAAADLLDAPPRLALVQPHVLVGAAQRDDPTCLEMDASPLTGSPGRPILSFIACAVVVRRDALLACGGFPERMGIGG